MADVPVELLVHAVTVERRTEGGFYDDGYGDPVTVQGFVSHKRRRVRTESGYETVTETTITARLADFDVFNPGDRVTANGRTVTVDEVVRADDNGLGAPQHTFVVAS